MRRSSPRSGDALHAVLIVAFILFAVPALLFFVYFLSYRTITARAAEEARRAEVAELHARAATAQAAKLSAGRMQAQLQPVQVPDATATVMQEDTGAAPVADRGPSQLAEITLAQAPGFARLERQPSSPTADPAVRKLVEELKQLDESEEAYERKLNELRTRLDLQLNAMHERLAAQIAETERRLQSLKQLHQQRGENQNKIVQRKIDELLGRADALQWELPSSSIPRGGNPFVPRLTPGAAMFPTAPLAPRPAAPLPPMPPVAPTAPSLDRAGENDSPVPVVQPPMPPLPPTPVAGNKYPPAALSDLDSPEIQLAEDNLTQGPVMQTELRDASGTIQSISNLIRRVADSQRKLESARLVLQAQEQQAADFGREQADEERIQAMRSQVAALERELALNQLELETVHASLHRKTEYLESRLLEKQRDLKAYQDLHRQGLTPIKEVNRIASEMAAAQAEWQEAEGVFGFLKESLDLIETGLDDNGEARNAEREATEQEAEKDDNEEQLEADSSTDMEGEAVEDVQKNEEAAE